MILVIGSNLYRKITHLHEISQTIFVFLPCLGNARHHATHMPIYLTGIENGTCQ